MDQARIISEQLNVMQEHYTAGTTIADDTALFCLSCAYWC